MKATTIKLTALLMAVTMAMAARAASFVVEAPRQVEVGQSFQVVYKLNNAHGTNFHVTKADGLKYLYGPARSEMSSSSNVNGHVSSSRMEAYTYTYRAERAGKVTIPAATIEADGRTLKSNSITINVVGTGQGGNGAPPAYGGGMAPPVNPYEQTAGRTIAPDDAFVHVALGRDNVYEQEAVVCTIKLYTKYEGNIACTKQPSFEGCLIEELPTPRDGNPHSETFNGKQYLTLELGKYILYPQQSGTMTVTSGNYDITVMQRDVYQAGGFMVSLPVGTQVRVKSNQATIRVNPLPSPQPAGFSGAVGVYEVTSRIEPSQLKTYQPSTYTLTVRGKGNLKYVTPPAITFPDQFDSYDPQTTLDTSPEGGDVSGKVDFEYRFIPQFEGEFDIDGVDFVYFNTNSRRYETIHIPSRHVTVTKGDGEPSSHYKLRKQDIGDIVAGDLALSRAPMFLVEKPAYWLAFAALLAATVTALLINRKRIKRRSDIKGTRSRRAGKVASRRLKKARSLMHHADSRDAFYNEVLNAFWGYLGDRLDIAPSELSKDNISAVMEEAGFDQSHIDSTLEVLDKCEFAQYAPELAGDDMSSVYNQASATMDELENVKLKKRQHDITT